jgi:hypothetical protein
LERAGETNSGRPVSSSRADAEKKTKLTKGARWSVHLKHEGVSGASSWRDGDGSEGEDWEEGGAREAHRSGGDRRRGRRAAVGVLLGHVQQAASWKGVGNGGAPP